MTATFRNGNLFCDNCGTEYKLDFPCAMDKMIKTAEVFEKVHKDCKKTWEQPKANLSQSIEQRAYWWMNGEGERGLSSITMWNCFMGNKKLKLTILMTRTIFPGAINYSKRYQNGKKD